MAPLAPPVPTPLPTDIAQNLSLLHMHKTHNSYKFKMIHNILLNEYPIYKPPRLSLITCATLITGSGTHVAKRGVILCIAVISDFIQVTNYLAR